MDEQARGIVHPAFERVVDFTKFHMADLSIIRRERRTGFEQRDVKTPQEGVVLCDVTMLHSRACNVLVHGLTSKAIHVIFVHDAICTTPLEHVAKTRVISIFTRIMDPAQNAVGHIAFKYAQR